MNRNVWARLHEIYLKGFQKSLEESDGNGIMTAYTRWGTRWSGGNYNLMNNIMREEWGNNGFSITDNVLVTYTNGVDGILGGGVTTFDAMLWYVVQQLPEYENDPVVVTAMRNAVHHNLYALANSSAMNGVGPDTVVHAITPPILNTVRTAMVVCWVLTLLGAAMWIKGVGKLRKTEEYANWKAYKKAK